MHKIQKCLNSIILQLSQKISFVVVPMVLLTFTIVILRYGFGIGKVWLQELVIYLHALFFVVGISYNFLKDTHVRVDIFYTKMSEYQKSLINFFGITFLVWPTICLIFLKSLPYVIQSYKILESSPDAGGLPARFLLKSLIPIMCLLIFIQTSSLAIKHYMKLKGPNKI